MAVELALPDPNRPKIFSPDGVGFCSGLDSPRQLSYRKELVEKGMEVLDNSSNIHQARARLLFIPFTVQVRAPMT